jgi:hypothetical protein
MTPPALLAALEARGVRFAVVGDRLLVDVPTGCLTPDDVARLKASKTSLLTLLGDGRELPEAPIEQDGQASGVTIDDVLQVFDGARIFTEPDIADAEPAPEQHDPFRAEAPSAACPACGSFNYHRAGDGWTCSRCHPPADREPGCDDDVS